MINLKISDMYFDSKIRGKKGLPWTDARTAWQRDSDEYFENLESLASDLDDIESDTQFITELTPDDFDTGYQYVQQRITELRSYIIEDEFDNAYANQLLESLNDVLEELQNLEDDAELYENYATDWDADADDAQIFKT